MLDGDILIISEVVYFFVFAFLIIVIEFIFDGRRCNENLSLTSNMKENGWPAIK